MSQSFVKPRSVAESMRDPIRVCRADGSKSVLVFDGPRMHAEIYVSTMNMRVVSEYDNVWYVESRNG